VREAEVSPAVLDRAAQLLAESSRLANEGQRTEAASTAQAAAEGLRVVQASADSDAAYLWLFTQALYTLTVRLIEAQRLDDAAAASHEAIDVSRQAAAAPGADVSAVASLMLSLSAQVAAAGLRPPAVDAAQAAADELRGFHPSPDAQTDYLWLFTQALYTLTVRLIEAGRIDDAGAAAHEAVQVARQAAAAPQADASAVASLMLSLSAQLAAAGLHPGAVEAAQAAADILRGEGARRDAWSAAMSQTPPPRAKGCFNATYPKTSWRETPCVEAPNRPYAPANVGAGNDWTATVAGAPISSATGSFDSVTGVTLETGTTFGSGPNCPSPVNNVPNIFALQLNTRPFTTTASTNLCTNGANPAGASPANGAANPALCQGWQQFIYSSTFNIVFIQYWLLNYTATLAGKPTCPTSANWQPSNGGCYVNSTAATVPPQTIANLRGMSFTASADSAFDSAKTMTAGNVPSISSTNQDSFLGLSSAWQDAEFNVFGDGCSSQAVFNAGTNIVVRTQVNAGSSLAPACTPTGFTAETTNLNLVGTPATVQTSGEPAIVFTESNPGGSPPSCRVSKTGLACIGAASSGSRDCTDPGGVPSTCASAICPAGLTLMGGGGACAAGDRKIKSLFPRGSDNSFTIVCEKQGVDPQAVAICCHL
jgi:hypothetical protein